MGQPGFFDLDERYQRLSENGDPLVKLAALIDFEAFRPKVAQSSWFWIKEVFILSSRPTVCGRLFPKRRATKEF